MYSSQSFAGVVITVCPPPPGRENGIRIEMGYPGPGFSARDDPRGAPEIKAALQAAGKLK